MASPHATRAAKRCRTYDVYCPLGSLPLALKAEPATIPADIPYLRADDAHLAKWRPAVEALPGKRVALAWAGHARHANDRNRSIALKLLEPLFALDGVSFVSIQRELRDDDAALLAHMRTASLTLAATCGHGGYGSSLALADLTISVDTSVAHLAGAMGRDVWVLLPFSPDWRWTLTGDAQPLVPAGAAVSSARARRLDRRDRDGARRAAANPQTGIIRCDQAATRIAHRSRRLRMRLEPITRGALCAADLGITHLFSDLPAQLRGILVAAHGRDIEPLVRLHQVDSHTRARRKTMPRPKQSSAFAGSAPPAAISMLVILAPRYFSGRCAPSDRSLRSSCAGTFVRAGRSSGENLNGSLNDAMNRT